MPMRPLPILACALAALALASAAPARADGLASQWRSFPWRSRAIHFAKHIIAHPGEAVRADTFYALGPDCSQRGWPQMQIRFAPSIGQVWDEHGIGHPAYPVRNVRHLCNGTIHPGDVVYYRAPEGFRGTDHFTVYEVFPDERASLKSIDVEVR